MTRTPSSSSSASKFIVCSGPAAADDLPARSLLAPLGAHRRSFIPASKGKRKRSKRAQNRETPAAAAPANPAPPVPELSAYVDVGLAKISRTLQAMSPSRDEPGLLQQEGSSAKQEEPTSRPDDRPYSVVFAARSGRSSAFHCHFPQMVALAARSQKADDAVRLVGLSKACEDRLSAALGIPRVSSIALREGAPQAKGLVDFVREHVAPVKVPWLEEAQAAQFLETRIDPVPTKIGSKKPRLS
ncbi:uncharacterized protein THITE_2119448 [Thermothielavioides terrestris NRRL 8126]|uniref:Uncharacterized protein n=1 Tax=Thermothielavioides terrestris (strain ATCC 38088 / NRRL 8126) TaxID=578455 RepID=G2RBT8_THETT|nr:uncharacterized protein THITE_2119448 [Thermothielavioides terrestris NRRL 8126]AEO69259.1 hypothetical protein THITE_2119448 [Thermothielavioides terrestris NRRL 8126]